MIAAAIPGIGPAGGRLAVFRPALTGKIQPERSEIPVVVGRAESFFAGPGTRVISTELFGRLLEVLHEGIIWFDPEGRIIFCSGMAGQLLGLSCGEPGGSVFDCHPPALYDKVRRRLAGMASAAHGRWHRVIKRQGRYVENYYAPVMISGVYQGIAVIARDVTERELLQKALEKSLQEMKVLFETARDVNASLDTGDILASVLRMAGPAAGLQAGGIFLVTGEPPAVLERVLTGYPPEKEAVLSDKNILAVVNGCRAAAGGECRLNAPRLALAVTGDDAKPAPESRFDELLLPGAAAEAALPLVSDGRCAGVLIAHRFSGKPFSYEEMDLLKKFAALAESAVTRSLRYRLTEGMACRDTLTGLYNRNYFEYLTKEDSAGFKMPVSMIMVDANGLKTVNDKFGHAAGDRLLKAAARVIRRSVRRHELAFRYGGDEMVLLLPGVDATGARTVLSRLRHQIKQWNREHPQEEFRLSLALGAATAGEPDALATLLTRADAAMYVDKQRYYARKQGKTVIHPLVDGKRCVGCGNCVLICPAEPAVFAMAEGRAVVANAQACQGCRDCVAACPSGAVCINSVEQDNDQVVHNCDKGDLTCR
ncbi:diguanylate cyclase [Desulfotomaculum copahuensis]|uniref:Diguanylate cyclase n=1 Tax=Desulfotomaculum copahuensis TaxID=1838280 RepID=A0A1B7LIZ8_9FIRM|nr:diguanylate cyclase [Desulfotomaculum copahuensis]OAT86523.1 hypothetical protein A6M21_03690 [Desulfotomaculum copahuensis]